jgi:hypothetical protein
VVEFVAEEVNFVEELLQDGVRKEHVVLAELAQVRLAGGAEQVGIRGVVVVVGCVFHKLFGIAVDRLGGSRGGGMHALGRCMRTEALPRRLRTARVSFLGPPEMVLLGSLRCDT